MSFFDGVATAPANLELISAGLQPAVLAVLLDHGTHEDSFTRDGKDERRHHREIGLFYVLTSMPNQPMLALAVNRSFAPNSNLVKWYAGCLGRTITIGEAVTPSGLLGKPVLVIIEHKTSKTTGRPYAAIKAVMPPLAGQAVPALKLQPFSWTIGDGPIPPAVEALPYVFGVSPAQRIKDSPEYRKWAAAHPANPVPGNSAPGGGPAPASDKDVPF
jgi:hypothetical protein